MKLDAKHIAQNHGIAKGGTVQKYVDNACIRAMEPYTPARNMILSQSARKDTVITVTSAQTRIVVVEKGSGNTVIAASPVTKVVTGS